MYLYVSGKYGTGNVQENIEKAREASIKLWQAGHTVLTPHLNSANMEDIGVPYDEWIRRDLIMIERCDGIYMLNGWEESNGARIEKKQAEEWGIPVYFEANGIPAMRSRSRVGE